MQLHMSGRLGLSVFMSRDDHEAWKVSKHHCLTFTIHMASTRLQGDGDELARKIIKRVNTGKIKGDLFATRWCINGQPLYQFEVFLTDRDRDPCYLEGLSILL